MKRYYVLMTVFVLAVCVLFSGINPALAIEKKFDYRQRQKINKAIANLENMKGNESRESKKDLIKWGGDAVEPLIAVIKDWKGQPAELRVVCVDILGEIEDRRAVPVIIDVLTEKKMTMRYNAARALGRIGDNRATPALIKLLNDKEWEVRFYTVEALGKIGDNRAAKPLANIMLSDSHTKVRLEAIKALDKVDGRSQSKAVVRALSDSDPEVRGYAAELCASWDIADALPAVTKMLRQDRANITRASCAHALGIYNNFAAIPALIQALGDDYKDVRIYARESLKEMTGQNFGYDKEAWSHWFELNKDKPRP